MPPIVFLWLVPVAAVGIAVARGLVPNASARAGNNPNTRSGSSIGDTGSNPQIGTGAGRGAEAVAGNPGRGNVPPMSESPGAPPLPRLFDPPDPVNDPNLEKFPIIREDLPIPGDLRDGTRGPRRR